MKTWPVPYLPSEVSYGQDARTRRTRTPGPQTSLNLLGILSPELTIKLREILRPPNNIYDHI